MKNRASIVASFYAIVYNADPAFDRLNRIIKKQHYELIRMPLPQFEQLFRTRYALAPFNESQHPQKSIITYNCNDGTTASFAISEEFYQALNAYYGADNCFFKTGSVALLCTRKVYHKPPAQKSPDRGLLIQDLEKMRQYADRLGACLNLAGYGHICFHLPFAFAEDDANVTPYIELEKKSNTASIHPYLEKDNAFVAALMGMNYSMNAYLQYAVRAFDEAMRIRDEQVRLVQLLDCLETCFHTDETKAHPPFVARYSSILVAINKKEFMVLYDELIQAFGWKKKILKGDMEEDLVQGSDWRNKLSFLEEMARNVIRKLLYLNIKTREELFYKLDLKTLPGQFPDKTLLSSGLGMPGW